MSEANNPAEASEANNPTEASEANNSDHHVDVRVERGNPSDEDIAALVAVLAGASGGRREPVVPPRNMWGHPVTNLRYAVFSWQRMTLLGRTFIRR